MGVAILLTTELGILDAVARISADLIRVRYLSDSVRWTPSRLYFLCLWSEIALGVVILLVPGFDKPLFLIKTSAAMNGGVMCLYSALLLYLNARRLPRWLAISPWRALLLVWSRRCSAGSASRRCG